MAKKQKIRSFAKRLARWIGIAQLIVMALVSWLIYDTTKDAIVIEETDVYRSYLRQANEQVSGMLSEVSCGAVNHVYEIEDHLDQPDKMTLIMNRIVAQNPLIRSCGVSFVDGYYPKKGQWFCPYAYRDDDGQIKERIVGDASHDYLKAEWFTEALEADSCYWSKPFFEGGDTLRPQVSYLVPIHDKQGRTVAVLGADMSLNWFNGKKIQGMNHKGQRFNFYVETDNDTSDDVESVLWEDRKWRLFMLNFIIDGDGTYIAHPDSDHVLRKNYFELAKATPDTIDDHIGRLMVAGEKGCYGEDDDMLPSSLDFFDMEGFSACLFYEPVPNTNWSIGMAVPNLAVNLMGIAFGAALLLLIFLSLVVVWFVGKYVIKRAVKPLNQLADSANEVAKGNFNAPLPQLKHYDEIHLLRDSFEEMQHSLTHYIDELKDTTASKAAIENELKVAHDIQMSMLPKTFPPYPERDDIDIYGSLTPAKDVGGDLFDFYIRNEKLFFCVGDVSGKGVPASLVMAVTRSLFRNISAHVAEPDEIVRTLNNAMAEGNDTNMFVTLFVGVLDLATGLLEYCNAGHNYAMLIGNLVSTLPCDPNLPIGVMPDMTFTKQQLTIEPETTIFLYTDGLNEAEDPNHVLFGVQRIIRIAELMVKEGKNDPTAIINEMIEGVHRFVDDAEQSDDMTILAIKYGKRR
jgi:sigma-B regulation protein RsbU (phosphoserine phosphatase)